MRPKTLLVNPLHGNAPYMMGAWVAKELEDHYATQGIGLQTVMPHIYGERQKRNLERVGLKGMVLDEQLGSLLKTLLFSGGNFCGHFDTVLSERAGIELELRRYLGSRYDQTIDIEVNTGSRVRSGSPSYYFFPAVASEIFTRSGEEEALVEAFTSSRLDDMAAEIRPVDDSHRRLILPGYHTFSYDDSREPWKHERTVPTLTKTMEKDTQAIPEESVYINLSGTESEVGQLLEHARQLQSEGRHVFVSKHASDTVDISEFPQALPGIVMNKGITEVWARAGMGTVCDCIHGGNELHILPYRAGDMPDDPEIYFNVRTLSEKPLLDARRELLEQFRDLDGPKAVAKIILTDSG